MAARKHHIAIRVSEAEWLAAKDAAAKRGISITGLVRMVLARIVSGTDLPPRTGRAALANATRDARLDRAKSPKPEGSTR